MRATSIFAGNVEPLHRGAGVNVNHHPAHEVMRGWHHLDLPSGQIEPAIRAPFDHALELFSHPIGAKMGHGDKHALLIGVVILAHLGIDAAADHVACRALALAIVVEHETLTGVIDELPTCTAQTFFEHSARHTRVFARQEPGGMELHHLHIAQRKTCAQRHGEAVHRLVARGRVVLVHGRAAARRHQHRLRANKAELAGAHIDHKNACERSPVFGRDQADCTMFLKLFDIAGQHLLHQAIDDLDPGQIALVHGAVGRLTREGFLMQRAIRVAVKETSDLILQLADAHHGFFAKAPRHVLVGQPLAALDRVHEMPFDTVAVAQCHIIAALHHAGAAAFSDQPFDGNCDFGVFGG